eukprot:4807754-Pyramimonas_sp.AAC.1
MGPQSRPLRFWARALAGPRSWCGNGPIWPLLLGSPGATAGILPSRSGRRACRPGPEDTCRAEPWSEPPR